MVQQSIGSKMKKVDSASFASGLVGDELGEKQNVDDVSDDGKMTMEKGWKAG